MSSTPLPAQGDLGHCCQECAPWNLESFFLDRSYRQFNAGPVTRVIGSSCPFAKLICLALDLYCGPAWAMLSQQESASATTSAIPEPNLMLARRMWSEAFGFQEQLLIDDPNHARLMVALDSQPSWARPVTYEGKPHLDLEADRAYVFGELEIIPEPHKRAKTRGLPRRRSINPIVDTRLIRTWLDSCKHRDTSHDASSEILWDGKGLRLIDVQLCCLAHVTERHAYLALSYPWGSTARGFLCATTSNIEALCQTGALDIDAVEEHQGKAPSRTVLDAMYLARGLGFRYLWVDALCILQDDADERRRLIHGMGGIYGAATCTIICAAGTNADSGLKGVWNTVRERVPYDEPVRLSGPRLESFSVMLSRPSLGSEVRRSHWNTRGWTYQEMCLSSRSLYFNAGEVFFSCFSCHNREGYEFKPGCSYKAQIMAKTSPLWNSRPTGLPTSTGKVHFHHLPSDPAHADFAVYRRVVQDYTKRELTLSSDVINAFQGVFNRFIDLEMTHLTLAYEAQCLPPRFLHLALLWYPISGSARRCSSSQNTTPSQFSSWSWTSWHGPVTFISGYVTVGIFKLTIWKTAVDRRGDRQPPERIECLIQSSTLPQTTLSPSGLSFSKMATKNDLSLSSPDTRQLPAGCDQSHEPRRLPVDIGLLELCVPVIPGSAVCLSSSPVPGWWTLRVYHTKMKSLPTKHLPIHKVGWFRFDEGRGNPMSLHSFLAVAMSAQGTFGVVGVVQNDDGESFRRMGVGWINLRSDHWRQNGNKCPNNGTTWTLERVLLR